MVIYEPPESPNVATWSSRDHVPNWTQTPQSYPSFILEMSVGVGEFEAGAVPPVSVSRMASSSLCGHVIVLSGGKSHVGGLGGVAGCLKVVRPYSHIILIVCELFYHINAKG